jgi:hypothetical protein
MPGFFGSIVEPRSGGAVKRRQAYANAEEGQAMPFDGVETIPNEAVRKIDEVIGLLASPDSWCKGALRSHDGRYCIRGAVRAVDAVEALEPTILDAIGQVAGKRFRRIESFNDHPSTSHDQVLAVLGRARESLSSGIVGAAVQRTERPPSRLAAWRETMRGWLGR